MNSVMCFLDVSKAFLVRGRYGIKGWDLRIEGDLQNN